MTHPFHPLHGQVLEVVDRRHFEFGERLYLEVEPGRIETLPVAWTSLGPPDVWLDMAAGRSLFRVDDLLRLADLIASIREEAADAV